MNPTIERLRQAEHAEERRLSLAEVRGVVDGILAVRPLADIAATTGLDDKTILDVTAELGTWLTHVHGGADATIVSAADHGQQQLLQAATGPARREVVVPLGFERRAGHRRDVSRALAAIVVHAPDDKTLTRWLSRKYQPSRANVVTFSIVSVVWRFATLGRLGEIDRINANNAAFAKLLVAAYDLLDVARRDAIDGVITLATADTANLDALAAACVKARWLNEGRIARLERTISLARSRPGVQRLLAKELRSFAAEVRAQPDTWAPTGISKLSEGQVRRICQAAGLSTEGPKRAEEADVRRRLAELGLRADADRLVPDAIRAAQAGVAEEFWAAMELRAAGDPDWESALAAAFDGVDERLHAV